MNVFEQLPEALLPWYEENKRDLPWRRDRQPYHVWLSEIMLQQTRVEAVKGYYLRFLDALPSIADLAVAQDELLHKLWEGLGYYSRVRNLKKAAMQIMERHSGQFPDNYEDVLALPGIGAYTAGAICSICFDQPKAAVDGNVLRVISRLTENDTPIDSPAYRKEIQASLEAVYPGDAGAFTQALMELGATVCGPNRSPLCEQCPCHTFCVASRHGTAERLPVKKARAERKIEEITVLILSCEGSYALEKRPASGLLAGLWQFPNFSGRLDAQETLAMLESLGLRPRDIRKQVIRTHVFTHIQWDMVGFYVEVMDKGGPYTWMTAEQIETKAALPTAFRQFREEENV